MLQLGSRQGMRHVQLGFGEQSCKLGSSQLQTHEIVPILAQAQQHYCGMLQLGLRQGMRYIQLGFGV